MPLHEKPEVRGRWVAAVVPPAILAAGFLVLAVSNWGVVRGAVRSGQALLVVVLTGVGWLGLTLLLRRFVGNPWVRSGVLGVAALVLVGLLVGPVFRDEKVVERFPALAVAPVDDEPAPPDAPAPAPTVAPAPPAAPVPAAADPVDPAVPVRVAAGPLAGIDHSASGTAAVYRQPDGTFVVGLEEIDIENGPDYFVHVVPGAGREDPDGGRDLGGLRGNQGTQYYPVPAGVDPTGWTVLVWCRTFAVPVANATPV